MPQKSSNQHPHIIIRETPASEPYRNPSDERPTFTLKQRDRSRHGQKLRTQLASVERAAGRMALKSPNAAPSARGIYIEFESDKGFDLRTESLEARRQGIELVAVREEGKDEATRRTFATVFVREGKVEYFVKKVEKYLEAKATTASPPNKTLVESISNLRVATLQALWTDAGEFPSANKVIWWEAWLRKGKDEAEQAEIVRLFKEHARRRRLALGENELHFPESTVLLIRASAEQLTQSLFLLNALAELRAAKRTADFFTNMSQVEQAELVRDLGSRITPLGGNDPPVVCLLDTGVNNKHPLLEHSLSDADMDSYNPAWGNSDNFEAAHRGHGTQMAGLALYGDLTEVISWDGEVHLTHRLESVKIIPPAIPNRPELYGAITVEGVARAEQKAPYRNRAVCLTASATDSRDAGRPSSWSSAIDQMCAGAGEEDEVRRLVITAAGNTALSERANYPDSNETDTVHDPGQAWNAVTVGAYTEKVNIDPTEYPGWSPLAPAGRLSPCSTTSVNWETQWPLKPDVVMEGGNMASHTKEGADYLDSLSLLSTCADWQRRLLITTGDTSGATALAAGMSAKIYANYPDLWPETVRGLLIHSARWKQAMLEGRDLWQMKPREVEVLLRKYGYGVPDLESALYSASDSLTLIAQERITPFVKEEGDIKTHEMHLHNLPWPREALLEIGKEEVELRVTLSYFIEPKPERKGFRSKYRYASHGLRFDMNTPTETRDRLRKRINRVPRGDSRFAETTGDFSDWLLGSDLRTRGSIHSDFWRGTAAALAEKHYVAVFPVKGWWSESPHLQRWDKEVRYSLIVSIRTPGVDTDIYTPVANVVMV